MTQTTGSITINIYQGYAPTPPLIQRIGPVTRKDTMLTVTISDTEQVHVQLNPDGPVDGIPTWAVISGQSDLLADADGLGAMLISEDDVDPADADTVYRVTADVDMGAGLVELTDEVTLHVTKAQATTLGLTAASPEPKAAG